MRSRARDRYSCTNSKTINGRELEGRVLNRIPVAFYSLEIFDRISQRMIAVETGKPEMIFPKLFSQNEPAL